MAPTNAATQAVRDFSNFLGLEANLDKLRGVGEKGEHTIFAKLFKEVKTIIIRSPHFKIGQPLKFGVMQSIWNVDSPQKLWHTVPQLEQLVANGPNWQEEHVIDEET